MEREAHVNSFPAPDVNMGSQAGLQFRHFHIQRVDGRVKTDTYHRHTVRGVKVGNGLEFVNFLFVFYLRNKS